MLTLWPSPAVPARYGRYTTGDAPSTSRCSSILRRMSTTSVLERFRGAMLGLAIGDAVGTTNEFRRPGTFPPINDMVGGGQFGLQPGQWTDDTSMALCLAESLVECGGFDARDQMDRYMRWRHEGYLSSTGECFDVGTTVDRALNRYRRTGDPNAGSIEPNTAGNGSLMRLAPVVLFFMNDDDVVDVAAASSRTTHGAPEAVDACRYFANVLSGALRGASKEELLSDAFVLGGLAPKIEEIARGSYKNIDPPDIQARGYVVPALEAALWAFDRTDTFRDGCLAAANLGGDADTVAAIFGQVGGAFYGEGGIPAEWRESVSMSERIVALADAMYARAVN